MTKHITDLCPAYASIYLRNIIKAFDKEIENKAKLLLTSVEFNCQFLINLFEYPENELEILKKFSLESDKLRYFKRLFLHVKEHYESYRYKVILRYSSESIILAEDIINNAILEISW